GLVLALVRRFGRPRPALMVVQMTDGPEHLHLRVYWDSVCRDLRVDAGRPGVTAQVDPEGRLADGITANERSDEPAALPGDPRGDDGAEPGQFGGIKRGRGLRVGFQLIESLGGAGRGEHLG